MLSVWQQHTNTHTQNLSPLLEILRLLIVVNSRRGELWIVIKVFVEAVNVAKVEAVFLIVTVLLVTGGSFVVGVLSTSRILFPASFPGVAQVACGP